MGLKPAFEDYLERSDTWALLINANDKCIVWSNVFLAEFLGKDPVSIRMPLDELSKSFICPEDQAHFMNSLNKLFKDTLNSVNILFRLKNEYGYWKWMFSRFAFFTTSLKNQQGLVIGFVFDVSVPSENSKQFGKFFNDTRKEQSSYQISLLTRRELQILPMIAKGMSYTQISRELSISPETVNSHRKHILAKLQLKKISQLSAFAQETGLV